MADNLRKFGKGIDQIIRPADMPRFLTKEEVKRIRINIYKRTLQEIEAFAWEILPAEIPENAKYEYGEDGYTALAFLSELVNFKGVLEEGDPEHIAAFALSLGMSYKRVRIGRDWNKAALSGEKHLQNNQLGNAAKQKKALELETVFKKMAGRIRKVHPEWSKLRIARQIHKELSDQGFTEGIAVNTIRQKI